MPASRKRQAFCKRRGRIKQRMVAILFEYLWFHVENNATTRFRVIYPVCTGFPCIEIESFVLFFFPAHFPHICQLRVLYLYVEEKK